MSLFSTEEVSMRGLWAGAAFVLVWRVAAFVRPYDTGRLGTLSDPAEVRLALAVMGLAYAAIGLYLHLRRPSASARSFAWYALATGLHWGGSVGAQHAGLNTTLLVFYLIASDLLATTFLLRFAFELSGIRNRFLRGAAYLPVLLAALIGLGIVLLAEESAIAEALVGLLPLVFLASMVLSIVVLAVLVVGVVRPRPGTPSRGALLLFIAVFVATAIPSLLGASGFVNLIFIFVPLAAIPLLPVSAYTPVGARSH